MDEDFIKFVSQVSSVLNKRDINENEPYRDLFSQAAGLIFIQYRLAEIVVGREEAEVDSEKRRQLNSLFFSEGAVPYECFRLVLKSAQYICMNVKGCLDWNEPLEKDDEFFKSSDVALKKARECLGLYAATLHDFYPHDDELLGIRLFLDTAKRDKGVLSSICEMGMSSGEGVGPIGASQIFSGIGATWRQRNSEENKEKTDPMGNKEASRPSKTVGEKTSSTAFLNLNGGQK